MIKYYAIYQRSSLWKWMRHAFNELLVSRPIKNHDKGTKHYLYFSKNSSHEKINFAFFENIYAIQNIIASGNEYNYYQMNVMKIPNAFVFSKNP